MKLRFKLFIFTLLSVLVLASATTFAVTTETPPANAEIGNQATLEYVTGTDEHRTVVSNIVITLVNPFYGVDIDPPIYETAKKGEVVYYVHTVTNIGNIEDTYDFTLTGFSNDYDSIDGSGGPKYLLLTYENNQLKPLDTLTLKAGQSDGIIVGVKSTSDAPSETPLGEFEVRVTSTTEGQSSVTDFINDNLELSENAIISAYKGFSEGFDGAVVGAPVNSGGTEEAFMATFYFQNSGGTPAGEIILTDNLDPRFELAPGKKPAISLNTVDSGNFKETSYGVGLNNVIIDKNAQETQVTITIAKNALAVADSIADSLPNFQLKVSFWLQAKDGTPAGIIPNEGTFTYDNAPEDGDDSHNSGGTTNEVTYTIEQIADLTFYGEDVGEVEQGSLIVFRNVITNTGNGADTFDISYIDNEFPSGSKFYLSHYIEKVDGEIQEVTVGNLATYPDVDANDFDQRTPLIDTNNDLNDYVDTGIMQPGEKQMILLWVDLPLEATGTDIKLDKLGVSEYDPEISDRARDECDIMTVSVDITNNRYLGEGNDAGIGAGRGPEAAPVTEVSVNPGDTGYINLYINNTAKNLADEYELEVSTDQTFETVSLPEGVKITLVNAGGAEISSTDVIDPGEHENIRAKVDVALGALAGDHYIYFRARSAQTGVWDIKTDMVKIGTVRSLTIVPQNEGLIYAGDSIVYPHTIKNAGNVLEGGGATSSKGLIKMTNSRTNHFSSTCYWDKDGNGVLQKGIDPQLADLSMEGIEGLEPGEEIDVFVEVQSANSATVDMQNTTKIRLDVNKGVYKIYHPDVFTYDITTIIEDELDIVKYQGHGAYDGDGPDNPADFTKDVQYESPGGYIYYKIVAKNTGTTTVNGVHIEDLVPQYTSMVYSDQSAILENVDDGGVIGVPGWRYGHEELSEMKPADIYPDEGEDGLIEAVIDELGPNQTAELYFAVKINGEIGNAVPLKDDGVTPEDASDRTPVRPNGE